MFAGVSGVAAVSGALLSVAFDGLELEFEAKLAEADEFPPWVLAGTDVVDAEAEEEVGVVGGVVVGFDD